MTIVKCIRTANQEMSVRQFGTYRAWITAVLDRRWAGATPDWTIAGVPVFAYVNRSSWVAQCPDCPELIIVEPGEPFYCVNCQNERNGGRARMVIFPVERAAIERLLLCRIDPNTRNWLLDETVEDLRRENLEHGEQV